MKQRDEGGNRSPFLSIDGGMNKKPNLLKILILLWAIWPGAAAALLGNTSHDVFGYVLKNYFLYPPGIDYIANHWLANDLLWKRIYVNAWCINGYLVMVFYIYYLLSTNRWMVDLKKSSMLRLFFLGVIGVLMSCTFYFGWVFSPGDPLSQKAGALIGNEIGLIMLFPVVWSSVSIFFFSGLAFFFVGLSKLFDSDAD